MTIGNEELSHRGATSRAEHDALPLGRLERWMRDHVAGFRGPLATERFEGGQSNPTYKLVLLPALTFCGASPSANCCQAPTRSTANTGS